MIVRERLALIPFVKVWSLATLLDYAKFDVSKLISLLFIKEPIDASSSSQTYFTSLPIFSLMRGNIPKTFSLYKFIQAVF